VAIALGLTALGCAGDKESTDRVRDPVEQVDVTVREHGIVTCDDAALRSTTGPFQRATYWDPGNHDLWVWAGALMAGDIDGDGLLDMLAPNEYGLQLYTANADGSFDEVGPDVFGDFDLTFGTGGSVADYDGDGDLDVYVTRFVGFPAEEEGPEGGRNRLLRNEGNLVFTDVTDEAGVDGCGYDRHTDETRCFRSMAGSWGDLDHDGDLDLFVGNYGFVDESPGVTQDQMEPAEPSRLYRNEGDGTFTDISDVLPDELDDGYTYAGGLFDLDDDGWLDLYTVNDFGNKWPNRVMWNHDGELRYDPDDASGLVVQITGMGLGLGDLNNDGWLDLAMPAWAYNVLLESRKELGIWASVASNVGFTVDFEERLQKVGWGTTLGDVDNDGDLDIVTQYGFLANRNPLWTNPLQQPDGLYINTPDGDGTASFEDVGESWGVADLGMGRGAMLADFNRDGWLDLAKRDLIGPNISYTSRCGGEGWLVVHLRQPETLNTHAIGAKVVLRAGGQRMQRNLVSGGTGFGMGEAPELHFGLGAADRVDRLEVTWPYGEVSILKDIPARQQVTLTRDP
jgi:hypothetical protein